VVSAQFVWFSLGAMFLLTNHMERKYVFPF